MNFLKNKLINENIKVIQCDDDADTTLVREVLNSSVALCIIVGKDIDLLVLVLMKIYFY